MDDDGDGSGDPSSSESSFSSDASIDGPNSKSDFDDNGDVDDPVVDVVDDPGEGGAAGDHSDLFPTDATAGLRRKNSHFVSLERLLGGVAIAPRYPTATAAGHATGNDAILYFFRADLGPTFQHSVLLNNSFWAIFRPIFKYFESGP